MERELWNRPVAAPAVRKAVTAINRKDGFESWVETLPFPLASVFWRYHAAGSEEHKVTHLLNAFEATTQFLGTLMASAFHSDAAFFRGHLHEWFEVGKDNPHSLARSSFGEWVVRCQRLAKTTRQMLSDKTQRDLVLGLYRADVDKVEGIVQKEIYQVMESVGRYRNDWKGHTGIVSLQEHERRLALLQDEVARLRGFLGGIFEDWWLIRPGLSSYTRGVHHYAVEKLVGSRQIFKQATVETRDVMDSTELYCYDVVTERPLQLLHFVRMLAVPGAEKVACFFYNRIEKEGIRWVSYHFETRVLKARIARDLTNKDVSACSRQPRRAASMAAMSIFVIVIIASKARFASPPPAASASVSARGVICQERPQRSLHQLHWLSVPPLPTIAFQ